MTVTPLRSRALVPPRDDLYAALSEALPKKLSERAVLVVTSKAVSIGEGRCVVNAPGLRRKLAEEEAERYLPPEEIPGGRRFHTLTQGILIGSAGIDESNSNGFLTLWPKDPSRSARRLRTWLRRRYGVREIGVLITDSHTTPLRRGAIGIALAYAGFNPLHDYRGTADIFGRLFKTEQANLADGLAASAVVAMGEGNEQTPFALIRDVPGLSFKERRRGSFSSLVVPLAEDVFAPFLLALPWRRGRKAKR